MEAGRWTMDDGGWTMDDGRWRLDRCWTLDAGDKRLDAGRGMEQLEVDAGLLQLLLIKLGHSRRG
ncbi:hypothetical protein DVH05_021429 [Phytophthora capsici]|nr:hypothetical protein DVH05_021429 [Phytophthora capsici]